MNEQTAEKQEYRVQVREPEEAGGPLAFTFVPGEPHRNRRSVAARLSDRATWIERASSLVDLVERWATEMGWATRRVEKKLDDARIGRHRVPALLMQQETFRVLLEPVGRSTPGADGVVDLYLMPAYDDIASLYFCEGRWNLHYIFPGTTGVATVREAEARPLTKESLEQVLAEMRRDAE